MAGSRQELMRIRHRLSNAKTELELAAQTAARVGETSFAKRLAAIMKRLGSELDFIERLIGRMP